MARAPIWWAPPPSVRTRAHSLLMFGTKIDRELLSSTGLPNGPCSPIPKRESPPAVARRTRTTTGWRRLPSQTARPPLVDGERYVMASAPVTMNGELSPVHVAVVMPIDALATEAGSYWTRTWLIFAAGAAVLLLAGFMVARRVVRPVAPADRSHRTSERRRFRRTDRGETWRRDRGTRECLQHYE